MNHIANQILCRLFAAAFFTIFAAYTVQASPLSSYTDSEPNSDAAILNDIASKLDSLDNFNSAATYTVLLPMAPDDVVYELNIQSTIAEGDRLSPCNYLIDWTLPTPSGEATGFCAYSDGNHYRMRDQRLQEYHFTWDSIPFLTSDGGVQTTAQFADLTPRFLARKLAHIASDSCFTYTAKISEGSNRRIARIDAEEIIKGYTARLLSYTFDADSGAPIAIEIESNPGEITEQTMSVKYYPSESQPIVSLSENALIERYPDAFGKYRSSNFRAENLPGTLLPGFSLPTPGGTRLTRDKNDTFASPTIVAMLDPSVASTPQTIAVIRSTLASLPYNVDIIWAFNDNHVDTIESLIGRQLPGESTIISAQSLLRDCGVNSFPTLLFVGRDGKIGNVQLGYNKNLPEIVMQSTALLAN